MAWVVVTVLETSPRLREGGSREAPEASSPPVVSEQPLLRWSVGLSQQINRRRFLRRTADGMFAGLMAVALGEFSLGSSRGRSRWRLPRGIPGFTQDCEPTTGGCCPYICCGPSPCCNTSCCSQDCCAALGSAICKNCSYKGDWDQQSCWQKNFQNGSCTYVITCCDCESRCSIPGYPNTCICTSKAKFCLGDREWSRWDPLTGRWIPASQDPLAVISA
jgi:hypothetical protein